ncbi:MAG: DUF3105 domain-containing protein [Chloroflexi bacterium]|jgi:hypothetical protein|nr:DUF3105 domain-containing protein [Chloroflexota bacterium]
MKSKREQLKMKRRRKKMYTAIGWGAAALIVLGVIGYALFLAIRPAMGEEVAVMPDTRHVPEGTNPGPYNTNPPTSGRHYEVTLRPGFYNEGDIQVTHPEGHLVHNLEHGYVIFWYNCSILSEQECAELKEAIQAVMEAENYNKVIAFPWNSIEEPVVLTSWGRLLRMERFDADLARDFVQRNRNKAPEPNAM